MKMLLYSVSTLLYRKRNVIVKAGNLAENAESEKRGS